MSGPSYTCKILSTHSHRYCQSQSCTCPCHEMMLQANYEKNDSRRVRRVG